MSDIYLQITETPTVVTLSAPVISGALSSTVTVANTVTVALDSNSLSALENVTVTVGAAITGTVTVSNFPASQAVTFSAVTISNFPSTQAVSLTTVPTHEVTLTSTTVTVSSLPALAAGTAQIGSVTASISGTVPVSGTFWQATQPVSGTFFQATQPVSLASTTVTVSSMPAVSGSVTLGAGTENIGVVTIGNIRRSGDSVQSSLLTEAGSGYLLTKSTLNAGSAQIGSVTASISGTVPVSGTFFQGTQPVSLTTLPAMVAGTAQIGSVTASISNSVTIASFATSVTARLINPAGTAVTYAEVGTAGNPSIDVLSVQGVSGGTSLLIGGTTGSFTTRFGSVTTANTAQISTAVTNSSRKYLFVQNVTTSSNVITVGIGFTPTTTQGIQLAAGALIDFESSFIPTGAVYILSSVTGSPFTILEA